MARPQCKFKTNDRVALKEDTKYRGKIVMVNEAQLPANEKETYFMPSVRWDNTSYESIYLETMLILEKELESK